MCIHGTNTISSIKKIECPKDFELPLPPPTSDNISFALPPRPPTTMPALSLSVPLSSRQSPSPLPAPGQPSFRPSSASSPVPVACPCSPCQPPLPLQPPFAPRHSRFPSSSPFSLVPPCSPPFLPVPPRSSQLPPFPLSLSPPSLSPPLFCSPTKVDVICVSPLLDFNFRFACGELTETQTE